MHLTDSPGSVVVSVCKLKSIGDAVIPLVNTSCTGVVTARFKHSAYLDFNNEWLCLALTHLGAGPTVLQLDNTTIELHESIQVGADVTCTDHQFINLGDCVIDTAGATSYSGLLKTAQSSHAQNINRWAHFLNSNQMSIGFAPLLRQIQFSPTANPYFSISQQNKNAQNESIPTDVSGNELLRYVAPAVDSLLNWLRDCYSLNTDTKPPEQVTKLLGAGPGLTPSGDDFLAGILSTLHITGQQKRLGQLRALLLVNASQLTTPVSESLLRQAAHGRVNEHAHQLVDCLLFSSEVNGNTLQRSIKCMGASSGWDYLTGVVLGMLACQD